jgi:hypothetical protein
MSVASQSIRNFGGVQNFDPLKPSNLKLFLNFIPFIGDIFTSLQARHLNEQITLNQNIAYKVELLNEKNNLEISNLSRNIITGLVVVTAFSCSVFSIKGFIIANLAKVVITSLFNSKDHDFTTIIDRSSTLLINIKVLITDQSSVIPSNIISLLSTQLIIQSALSIYKLVKNNSAIVQLKNDLNYYKDDVELDEIKERIANRETAAKKIDVHSLDRDDRLICGVRALFEHQKHIQYTNCLYEQTANEIREFIKTLTISDYKKSMALNALFAPQRQNESFGPFISNSNPLYIKNHNISPKLLLVHLWFYLLQLAEPDRTNAKISMIHALVDCYDDFGKRVCNAGKLQRLIVNTLQGRLDGVEIDTFSNLKSLTVNEAVQIFFSKEEYQEITLKKALFTAAHDFCKKNNNFDKTLFMKDIYDYANVQFSS